MGYLKDTEEEEHNLVNEPDYAASYTAADYLKWTFEGLYELIRGKVFKMSPAPGSNHQRISSNLLPSFHRYFRYEKCEVFHAPFDVYLVHPGEDYTKTKNIVEPDICIVCDPSKIKRRGCAGAPDLIVEIISPSSLRRDVDLKYSLYEEYGVREYWIVHPQDKTVSINVLQGGRFVPQRLLAKGQVLQSTIFPDLTVNLEHVFPEMEPED